MATTRGQRIGIWVIAITMTVGTIGSFAAMVLSNQNSSNEQQAAQQQLAAQQQQTSALSAKYYSVLKPYQSTPAAFDASQVDSSTVATTDLVVGTGATIDSSTKYQAYYIGWTPDGKTFDSSFNGNALSAPIDTSTTSLIDGWNQGVVGMKVGGIREVTIPSKLAYGSAGSGSSIPPNTPIKFIIMIIATV